jgi:amidohydrolase
MPPASPASPEVVAHATALRRELHQIPELGYQEHQTSALIQRELTRLNIPFVAGLAGGTGVVAHLPATQGPADQPAIGLRADIDALPITEQTGAPWASRTPGRMHACGHDGHTAILLGAAAQLSALPHRPRPVTLVFQPAEEGGGGADKLCKQGLMEGQIIGPRIERMYGLHGWPELPQGVIGTRPGPLFAATDEFRVTIRGVQSHAAYPHQGADSVLCMAHCIVALQQIASRNVGPMDSVVVSTCIVLAGTAGNVLPETAEFIGTIRTVDANIRTLARARLHEIVSAVAVACNCRAEITIEDGYPVTRNDPALTEQFLTLTRSVLGRDRVVDVQHPTMGGEDFAYYAQRAPSVFFCLGLRRPGQQRHPALHQPEFDFNDDAIPLAIQTFVTVATA